VRARIPTVLLGGAVVAVCAVQLWLASSDEIVARANPYDQVRYLEMAESMAGGEWLGPFDVMTLTRDVGYPAWIAAVHFTGIPLRIANELSLLAASLLLCVALFRCGYPAGLCGGAFAILVLQPHSMLVQRDLLPSSFYATILILSLAGMLLSLTTRRPTFRWAHLCWTSVALGVLWVTRPEQPLIWVSVSAFVACDFATTVSQTKSIPRALFRCAGAGAILVAGVGSIAGTVAAINFHYYGVWRTADYQAPGFAAANRVLLSIVQENPRRLVPVPADVRKRAYAVSPAFAALRPVLEAPSWARGVSCNMDGVCDDIAGGYFRWILREAVAEQVDSSSATSLDEGLAQIARELEDACRSGTIECHRSVSSFLHPYPQTYLPHLVGSLGRIFGRMATTGGVRDRKLARDPPNLAPELQLEFDRIANRRVELAHPARDEIVVWAHATANAIVAATLDVAGQKSDLRLEAATRESTPGIRIRFEVEQPDRRLLSRYPVVEFQRESGTRTRVPIPLPGQTATIDGVSIETERWDKPPPTGAAQTRVRGVLWSAHAGLIRLATLAGGLSLVALVFSGSRARRWDSALAAITLIGVAVSSRLALLTMVDASSFPAFSTRYCYPTVSLFSIAMLLVTHRAWRVCRSH